MLNGGPERWWPLLASALLLVLGVAGAGVWARLGRWGWLPWGPGVGASLALLIGGPVVTLAQLHLSIWYLALLLACLLGGWVGLCGSLRPRASASWGMLLGIALYATPGLLMAGILIAASPSLLGRPLDLLFTSGLVTLAWPVYGLWITGVLGFGPN